MYKKGMMKTILVTADFSEPSQTASHFAMYLAKKMKACSFMPCHSNGPSYNCCRAGFSWVG
jgi:hypothetical protein